MIISILCLIIGGCVGFVTAAIMTTSSTEDRAREEQPPVFKVEEKKLIPLVAVQEIPFECISTSPNEIEEKAIANSLMGQFNDKIRQRVVWDMDPYRRKHIVKLRIWVDTEI